MTNSCVKGKVGEREFAAFLKGYGIAARRGQQHAGGGDSPDVVHSIPGVHFEVKRMEATKLKDWLAQAAEDAGDALPVIAHRKNRGPWIAIMDMDRFMTLLLIAGLIGHAELEPGTEAVDAGTLSDPEPGQASE